MRGFVHPRHQEEIVTRGAPMLAVLVGADFRGRSVSAAERSRALGRMVALPEYRDHAARAAAP